VSRKSSSRSSRIEEQAARGVLVLEGRSLPDDAAAAWVAKKAGVPVDAITFVVAPTASLAGGVQIVARSIETGLHKMDTLGFDVRKVV
jgi:methenyltetrahydromethanopterin cyclohydrolase